MSIKAVDGKKALRNGGDKYVRKKEDKRKSNRKEVGVYGKIIYGVKHRRPIIRKKRITSISHYPGRRNLN